MARLLHRGAIWQLVHAGITPAVDSNIHNTVVFSILKEYLMRVSYVEIYLERVNDLLQEGPRGGAVENLDVKEDPKKGFVVVGLHEEAVASMEEVMTLLSK